MQIKKVFDKFKHGAIPCETITNFNYFATMSTNHARDTIIGLLDEKTLYCYQERLLIRLFGRMSFVDVNHDGTLRIRLGFSPKHICHGRYRNVDLKQIDDPKIFIEVMNSLIKE